MIEYGFTVPGKEEYDRLRSLVGWEKISEAQFENGMKNSISVSAREGGKLVGYARTITDRGMLSFIVDVMVDPGMQRQGIGKALVRMLMDAHKEWLAPGEIGYISVLSTSGREPFYKKLGFAARPNVLLGAGMTAKVRAPKNKNEIN